MKGSLDRGGIECVEVNIEETPGAMDFLMSVNGGNHTVPTVYFPSGAELANPSLS